MVIVFTKKALIGGLLIVGGSMFNRQYENPNTSRLLQLVVSIVSLYQYKVYGWF